MVNKEIVFCFYHRHKAPITMTSLIWIFVFAIHLLSIAYWVGASLFCLQLRRTVRLLEPAQASAVQLQGYARFIRALLHVIPVAFITGIALIARIIHAGGQLPWPYHLMALCAVVMLIIYLSMFFGPFRAARRAMRPDPAIFNALFRRTMAMFLFGVIAMLAAALGHG